MMRRDVTTSAVGRDVDSFRVGYVSDNPETARKVTERLASLYIDQNSKDREAQADSTSEFLDTQLAEAKRRLIEQEKKLEDYRKSHAGQMPSQLQGNLQAIQNANLQLQSAERIDQPRSGAAVAHRAAARRTPRRCSAVGSSCDWSRCPGTSQHGAATRRCASTSCIVPAALHPGSSGCRKPRANGAELTARAGSEAPVRRQRKRRCDNASHARRSGAAEEDSRFRS